MAVVVSEGISPRNAGEVEEAVQWALSAGKTLEVLAGGSRRAIGRPMQTDLTLDLSALTGITLYEPQELVLSARAGTPLAEIEAALASKDQQLAFEPMDCGPILGGAGSGGTIGGALASNLCGPRRIKAGAARDHFLGFTAVSGRGETFRSGGRVVKNVTGYDLCKLMAGSWGTLAALTDVTLKTLPRPETEETVIIRGLDAPRAITAMTSAMASGCDVSGAAHLPVEAAAHVAGEIAAVGAAVTALRLEGFALSVAHRKRVLSKELRGFGEPGELAGPASRSLWQAIRDVTPFAVERANDPRPLWRISVPPSRGAELVAIIAKKVQADALLDWAGGLLWLRLEPREDAGAAVIGCAVASTGGHATLIRAAAATRAAADVFTRTDPALSALSKRVKESFDPKGVFNPGRMWVGV